MVLCYCDYTMKLVDTMFIFASLPAHMSLPENLRFQTVGFIIVMVILGLIALVMSLVGWLFRNAGGKKPATGAGTALERSLAVIQEEVPHEMVAVIAAAVYSTVEEAHRIVSIRPVIEGKTVEDLYLQAWSVEGRRQHFASHKIR